MKRWIFHSFIIEWDVLDNCHKNIWNKNIKQTNQFHVTLWTSWKWILSKFLYIRSLAYANLYTSLNYSEIKLTMQYSFEKIYFILKKEAMIIVFFLLLHDSLGSLSSKLELNDMIHHASSQRKVLCSEPCNHAVSFEVYFGTLII